MLRRRSFDNRRLSRVAPEKPTPDREIGLRAIPADRVPPCLRGTDVALRLGTRSVCRRPGQSHVESDEVARTLLLRSPDSAPQEAALVWTCRNRSARRGTPRVVSCSVLRAADGCKED